MQSNLFAAKWSPTALDMLERMVYEGLSAGQISRKLSDHFGISYTRNSVISQIARKGWKLKGVCRANGERKHVAVTISLTKLKRPKAPPAPTPKQHRADVDLAPEPIAQGDTPDGCRWMHGEATDRNFCGAETFRSSRYCQHHFARVYIEPPPLDQARMRRLRKWLSRF